MGYSDVEVLQPPAEAGFGLFPFRSPLLRESRLISFPRLHEMFQFAACPLTGYVFTWQSPDKSGGVPPFGDPRVYACLLARRGISLAAASFIGIWSLGIHSLPYFSLFMKTFFT